MLIVKELKARGADAAILTKGSRHVPGKTPTDMARRFGHDEIVALLSAEGGA